MEIGKGEAHMLKSVFEKEARDLIGNVKEEDYEAVISILLAYTKKQKKTDA